MEDEASNGDPAAPSRASSLRSPEPASGLGQSVTPAIADGSWTAEELDRRHEEIVARFPGGLTAAEFRYLTLESAREDGRVYAPSIADWSLGFSMLMGMWLEGLIENRGGGYNKPFKWCITKKGHNALAQGIEARRAETGTGSVRESPTRRDAPIPDLANNSEGR